MKRISLKDRFLMIEKKLGIKMEQLGTLTGKSANTYRRYLSEKTDNPRVDTLYGICEAIPNINPVWLIMGEGEMLLNDEILNSASEPVGKYEVKLCRECLKKEGELTYLRSSIKEISLKNDFLQQEIGRFRQILSECGCSKGNENHEIKTGT